MSQSSEKMEARWRALLAAQLHKMGFTDRSRNNQAALFIEVDDFADTLRRLGDCPIAMPERVAFYGMREVGVFDPEGHVVIFAARIDA